MRAGGDLPCRAHASKNAMISANTCNDDVTSSGPVMRCCAEEGVARLVVEEDHALGDALDQGEQAAAG